MGASIRAALVLLALSFFAFSKASADPVFLVQGSMFTVGNAAPECAPFLCTETINFSFEVTPYIFDDDAVFLRVVPGSIETSSQGPLGEFGNEGDWVETFGGGNNLLGYLYFNSGGPEIDLGIEIDSDGLDFNNVRVSIEGAVWYTIGTEEANEDFIPPGEQSMTELGAPGSYTAGAAPSVYATGEVSLVPEPSSFIMLGFGFAGFLALVGKTRLFRPHGRRIRGYDLAPLTMTTSAGKLILFSR